jgi:DNA-binding XRE family transcriptional regulator
MSIKLSIRAARIDAGMTQPQAAKELGVCTSTIQNYEGGRYPPPFSAVEKMSALYGVPIENLYICKKNAKSDESQYATN